MCGIAGIVDVRGGGEAGRVRTEAARMAERLGGRGPDGAGAWTEDGGRIALAHRRLAILDVSEAGAQPMTTARGRFALAHNGEIYNAGELRARMPHVPMRGHCDAEVLLEHLAGHFMCPQPDVAGALAELEGMFAFAFVDAERRVILLARDAFGEKPLCYCLGPKRLTFASDLRALTRVESGSGEAWSVDPDALAEYLLLQYVHAPRTIYGQARKMRPGSYMLLGWDEQGIEVREEGRFAQWPLKIEESERGMTEEALIERVDEAVRASMEKRLAADVPVGVLLSGGIDSTLVAVHARMLAKERLRTFSLGFEGAREESEHEFARLTAAHLDTDHHEEVISADLSELLPMVAAGLDEPLGDSSCIPTWLVARMARKHVKVALTGDGGDEMFGGYQRYADVVREAESPLRRLAWRMRFGEKWTPANAYCSARWWMFTPEMAARLTGQSELPAGTARDAEMMQGMMMETQGGGLMRRMRALDVETYLPGAVLAKVDRMTMAHGLEARAPLLGPEVARLASGLSEAQCLEGWTLKPILRKALARYVPLEWTQRRKRGFGLPGRTWGRESMVRMAREWLLTSDAQVREHLDQEQVRRFVEQQNSAREFQVYPMYTLLALEAWLRS